MEKHKHQEEIIKKRIKKEGKGHGTFDKQGGWHGKNAGGGHFESGFNSKDNS